MEERMAGTRKGSKGKWGSSLPAKAPWDDEEETTTIDLLQGLDVEADEEEEEEEEGEEEEAQTAKRSSPMPPVGFRVVEREGLDHVMRKGMKELMEHDYGYEQSCE